MMIHCKFGIYLAYSTLQQYKRMNNVYVHITITYGIKQSLSNKKCAYRWFNELIKCIVGVFCADPHFNPGLGHIRLQMISDSVITFQLHTEGLDTGGVQVHLQLLCDSVCVEKKPVVEKLEKEYSGS